MPAKDYFKKSNNLPRETLLKAIAYFTQNPSLNKRAVDLGCGNGRDSYALLQDGWKVSAYDYSKSAIASLDNHPNLTATCCSFEDIEWSAVELINASFAIPFCDKKVFPDLWDAITKNLTKGGVFCGHFFGNEDSWQQLLLFSKDELNQLFESFQFDFFKEKKFHEKTISGHAKDWHLFEIVAIKN